MCDSMNSELQFTSPMPRQMPFHIFEQITNYFSDDHKIGSGGFGAIYKGVLNGEEVAVEKLHDLLGLDDKQFRNELENHMRLKHPNIVQLVGYCYEIRHIYIEYEGKLVFAEKPERIICLEYLHNGSLENYISDESSGLDWCQRFQIIKGICEGLSYLHEGGENCIYHLDLKPANILLDKNMVPKITNFGLSRRFHGTQTHITKDIIGTLGYMPKEYINHGKISKKVDVFSLGVIIIEIMTGPHGLSKIADASSQEIIGQVYRKWRNRLQEEWRDPSLECYCQQVKSCIRIALNCVEVDWNKRPSTGNIICTLNESETVIQTLSLDELNNIVPDVIVEEVKLMAACYEPNTEPTNLPLSLFKSITKNFDPDQQIGVGGFGVVYKGELSNGEVVAVKKLNNESLNIDDKSFENEISCVMRCRHENIVRLLGYCMNMHEVVAEYNGRHVMAYVRERLLCFEFIPGSLQNHLTDESNGLGWRERYRIIKGVCQGLLSLHEKEKIVHLDLKPANILLDQNMVPKISDFGLSRLFGEEQTRAITSKNPGTLGYMAPEYLFDGIITFKSDIYSLGAIILEVMTGKKKVSADNDTSSYPFVSLLPPPKRPHLFFLPSCAPPTRSYQKAA